MKRFLLILLAAGVCAASAAADENIRKAQEKLKSGGFYFGAVSGAASSDFSAAVTRYQIRNGLQITGTLNPETSKALGVKATATTSPATRETAPDPETWRRLRKANQSVPSRVRTTDPPEPVQPQSTQAGGTSVLEPIGDGKVKLSRERLRDYVAAFVLAGLDPQIGAELEFFADRVQYYNDGMVSRDKIRADLQRYDRRWPERHFWLAGDLRVDVQPDSRFRVTFPLRYELANGAKHRAGKIRKTLLLQVRGEDLEIVGVDENKA